MKFIIWVEFYYIFFLNLFFLFNEIQLRHLVIKLSWKRCVWIYVDLTVLHLNKACKFYYFHRHVPKICDYVVISLKFASSLRIIYEVWVFMQLIWPYVSYRYVTGKNISKHLLKNSGWNWIVYEMIIILTFYYFL